MAATADKRTMEELTTTNRELSEAKLSQTPRPTGNIDWDPIVQNQAIKRVQPDQTIWEEVIGTGIGTDEIEEGQ
eukprot:10241078-Ditylum_brightwellii.AAC.1